MPQIHTHYDNLKVARNAPPEVIRAAYRTLSQKYHPDRNAGNSEAARIMTIINTSYDVLSVAEKRQEHDQWIAREEQTNAEAATTHGAFAAAAPDFQPSAPIAKSGGIRSYITFNWFLYGFWGIGGIAGILILIWANETPPMARAASKPYQSSPATSRAPYVKPGTAPNGQPWPLVAAYVGGYQLLNAEGLSSITVDNSGNDSEVFVKLVSLDGAQAYPARQFYIPAFGRFTLYKVTAGNYDIRYRDLGSGGLSRSDAFDLEETPTETGTQFSNMTMTLYKVKNGNMQTYGLSETEF